ncbi:MAG: Eco57I restriction-modification methylase domain-containing protein, partial [Parafannyhessea sp.]|uniref:Eco57I restriction-modification methylase domain-containing protein n=1 Tax=Parafannyhessea sp. TaxID=2847324 RepID=UPI003F09B026
MSSLFESTYNPDVLSCIANLSSDEVFTPPELVNQMLDMLPAELWSDPDATFLDPACKSGVFLREIAKRLIDGLAEQFPDLDERLEHIFKKQIFGIATTELTSLLSRRSLYCSKFPNGHYSVVQFDNPKGNVEYVRLEHTWENGRCKYCGATETEYKRDSSLEQYVYEFIHFTNKEQF